MSEEKKMNLHKQHVPAEVKSAASTAEVLSLRPLTDIHEAKLGVTLAMDLPGVSKESLDIDIDKNVLTIRGAVNLHTSNDLSPSYMELHSGVFERRFTMGDELDSTKIEATLKNGELILFIPHLERHIPRKIDIKVA